MYWSARQLFDYGQRPHRRDTFHPKGPRQLPPSNQYEAYTTINCSPFCSHPIAFHPYLVHYHSPTKLEWHSTSCRHFLDISYKLWLGWCMHTTSSTFFSFHNDLMGFDPNWFHSSVCGSIVVLLAQKWIVLNKWIVSKKWIALNAIKFCPIVQWYSLVFDGNHPNWRKSDFSNTIQFYQYIDHLHLYSIRFPPFCTRLDSIWLRLTPHDSQWLFPVPHNKGCCLGEDGLRQSHAI